MINQYHHDNLKNELIEQGIKLINKDGLDGLSLRRLAKLCNVSEAAPYKHFKNKEDLLNSIKNYISDELLTTLKNAEKNSDIPDSPQAITDMGKAYINFFVEHSDYFTFIFSQSVISIDLSSEDSAEDFPPYRYFKNKAYEVYGKEGFSKEKIKYGIVGMWAKVHGLSGIASMKFIQKDFEWNDEIDRILIE